MRLYLVLALLGAIQFYTIPLSAAEYPLVYRETYVLEGVFTGGRLSSLGSSDMADDAAAAVLINSAPLVRGDKAGLSYAHADYYEGVEFRTYAGFAQWKDWRLTLAVNDVVTDDELFRTAYNPEGLVEMEDQIQRMTVLGLSYDLGSGIWKHPTINWSVGAAWRNFSTSDYVDLPTTGTLDLGTTLAWRADYAGGWTALTGAISWQNALATKMEFNGRESLLPRPLRTGLTVETAWDWPEKGCDLAKLLVAYTRASQLGETLRWDSDHIGLELLMFETLAVRWGHSSRVIGDIASWGVGLQVGDGRLGPFTVDASVGAMKYDNDLMSDHSKTIWGLDVGYNF